MEYLHNIVSSVFKECSDKGKIHVSNFLNSSEQEIYLLEAKKYPDLTLTFDGGMENAEYQKAIITPSGKTASSEITI